MKQLHKIGAFFLSNSPKIHSPGKKTFKTPVNGFKVTFEKSDAV